MDYKKKYFVMFCNISVIFVMDRYTVIKHKRKGVSAYEKVSNSPISFRTSNDRSRL